MGNQGSSEKLIEQKKINSVENNTNIYNLIPPKKEAFINYNNNRHTHIHFIFRFFIFLVLLSFIFTYFNSKKKKI
jgi:hypothetical protein